MIGVLVLLASSCVLTSGFAITKQERKECNAYIYKILPCDFFNTPECDTMCFPAADCNAPGTTVCGPNWGSYKDEVVRLHNELRQKVASGSETRGFPGPQPAAKDMYELKWDDSLAVLAQRWAEQQYYGHDCGACRKNDKFKSIGQNCGWNAVMNAKDPLAWEGQIIGTDEWPGWYLEVKNWNGPEMKKGKGVTGHYTQVIWGKSKYIGCAVYANDKPCTYVDPSWGGFKCQTYVCNYAPGGNTYGEKPYKTTGDECPKKSSKYPNLCID